MRVEGNAKTLLLRFLSDRKTDSGVTQSLFGQSLTDDGSLVSSRLVQSLRLW